MFRKELHTVMHKIFGLEKTTYSAPSDAFEQDTLFIEVQDVQSNAGEGKASCKVTGAVVIFSQGNKLPYGFFNKKIQQAKPEYKKDLFFFDIDTDAVNSPARIQNIHERRCSFIYLYKEQYDPNQGELTSVVFNGDEEEE